MPSFETVVKAIQQIVLSPRIAVTVFFVCAALLVGSHLFPQIVVLPQQHKLWISLLLAASGFYSLTFPVEWAWRAIRDRVRRSRRKRYCVKRLQSLSINEKHVLQEYIENSVRDIAWSVNRMAINSLVHDGILGLIQQVGSIGYFRIIEGAREYLLRHPDLIATPGNPRPKRTGNEWMI